MAVEYIPLEEETSTEDLYKATPQEEEPVEEVEQPESTWEQEKAEYDARINELNQRIESLSPQLKALEEFQKSRAVAATQEITSKIIALNESSEDPLEDSEIQAIQQLVQDGINWRTESNAYKSQSIAGEAINRAGAYLAQDPDKAAVIRELQSLAKTLYDYGDSRIMDQHLSVLNSGRQLTTTANRRAVATARIASGVDNALPAPAQTGNASEFSILEQKMANRTATPAEESRFTKLYAANRNRHGR